MADDLKNSIAIAGSGLQAQSARLRVIAQNVANADSISLKPGGEPYRRKTISFQNVLDKELGAELVKVKKFGTDDTPFIKQFDPGNPAADKDGYIMKTNVDKLVEMMDMKEAQHSYEANLSVIDTSKSMLSRTLELMR